MNPVGVVMPNHAVAPNTAATSAIATTALADQRANHDIVAFAGSVDPALEPGERPAAVPGLADAKALRIGPGSASAH